MEIETIRSGHHRLYSHKSRIGRGARCQYPLRGRAAGIQLAQTGRRGFGWRAVAARAGSRRLHPGRDLDRLDRTYTDAGKPGVWSSFSEAGKRAIAASAVANCRLHPERTINQAAEAVYGSVRDIHIQLGIVK